MTILTRSASTAKNIPGGVNIKEVDYDSFASLKEALRSHDALVSTVAMSAIPNQTIMIDAAIAAGVKHFIPAEYSMATRDPKAQWLPIYSTVLEIQRYLEGKGDQIVWTCVNCGVLVEFGFDYPFILDFDNHVATLWDGEGSPVSMSDCRIVAQAIASLLKQPDRVQNHTVRVHGGTLTQRDALSIAQKYTPGVSWRVKERDSDAEIKESMSKLQSGATGNELMEAIITVASAATLGKGHFNAAYDPPDNDWLGVDLMEDKVIEEAIRRRIEEGPGFAFAGDGEKPDVEGMGDVSQGLVAKHNAHTE